MWPFSAVFFSTSVVLLDFVYHVFGRFVTRGVQKRDKRIRKSFSSAAKKSTYLLASLFFFKRPSLMCYLYGQASRRILFRNDRRPKTRPRHHRQSKGHSKTIYGPWGGWLVPRRPKKYQGWSDFCVRFFYRVFLTPLTEKPPKT